MTPPPTDFTSPEVLVDLTRERMLQSVTEGRPRTAMVAWKKLLTPEEIAGVVDYIRNSLMMASRAQDATEGRRLFARKCSVCHGDKGDVAVWARGGLVPAPRDFTTDNARWELTRERMIFSVSYGRPETAMPSWLGRLSKEEIEAVVSYIREAFLFPGGSEEKQASPKEIPAKGGLDPRASSDNTEPSEHKHDHYNTDDMVLPLPNHLVGQVAWGEKFYKQNCAVCHGEKGDGKGPRSDFVYPKPRDFLHPSSRHKFNRPHLFEIISKGTRGTEMPAWNKVLTDQEITNLAEFVFQTFIRPPGSGPASTDAGEHQHGEAHHETPTPPATASGHEHHESPVTPEKPAAASGHEHHAPPAPPVTPEKPAAASGHEHHAPPASPVTPEKPAATGGHEHPGSPTASDKPAAGTGGHEHSGSH